MGQRLLLVEGEDDLHVMANLFEVRGIAELFRIERAATDEQIFQDESTGGINVLLESVRSFLEGSGLECLAIVLDADDKGPAARWQSLRQRIVNLSYENAGLPTGIEEDGVVFDLSLEPFSPRSVRLSAWVMPDNRSFGMLEDFVLDLIPAHDEMMPRVRRFLDSIPESARRFSATHFSKARIHSWLAVSKRPGRPMGQAIKCDPHNIDVNHPTAQAFLDWIKRALID